ncbi:MAG: DUF4330 domain-containing protein [Defluviitaleaceae bacterium]|nr:DUF4330 domain-containing protein [Defluviitaleaceae bacterium]
MDKNGKIFGKISVVDLLVALLIVVVALGTVYRFASPAAAVDRGEATVHFVLRIEGVRDFTAEGYRTGLRVYDRQTGQFIGHVDSVEVEPHYEPVTLHDGTIVRAYQPGRIAINMGVVAEGRLTPTAIYVEGTYELTAGSMIYIATKYVQVMGFIYSISTL